jgi:hypothetical protein
MIPSFVNARSHGLYQLVALLRPGVEANRHPARNDDGGRHLDARALRGLQAGNGRGVLKSVLK